MLESKAENQMMSCAGQSVPCSWVRTHPLSDFFQRITTKMVKVQEAAAPARARGAPVLLAGCQCFISLLAGRPEDNLPWNEQPPPSPFSDPSRLKFSSTSFNKWGSSFPHLSWAVLCAWVHARSRDKGIIGNYLKWWGQGYYPGGGRGDFFSPDPVEVY